MSAGFKKCKTDCYISARQYHFSVSFPCLVQRLTFWHLEVVIVSRRFEIVASGQLKIKCWEGWCLWPLYVCRKIIGGPWTLWTSRQQSVLKRTCWSWDCQTSRTSLTVRQALSCQVFHWHLKIENPTQNEGVLSCGRYFLLFYSWHRSERAFFFWCKTSRGVWEKHELSMSLSRKEKQVCHPVSWDSKSRWESLTSNWLPVRFVDMERKPCDDWTCGLKSFLFCYWTRRVLHGAEHDDDTVHALVPNVLHGLPQGVPAGAARLHHRRARQDPAHSAAPRRAGLQVRQLLPRRTCLISIPSYRSVFKKLPSPTDIPISVKMKDHWIVTSSCQWVNCVQFRWTSPLSKLFKAIIQDKKERPFGEF